MRLSKSILLIVAICILGSGCRPQKPIEVSHYDKPQYAMLAGILITDNVAWTIKATGKQSAIAEAEDSIYNFAKTLEFPEGATSPKWNAPKEWRDTGETNSFRVATFEINPDSEDDKIVLLISFLSTGRQSNPNEFIAGNINRWREQMGVQQVLHYTMVDGREIELPIADLIVPFMKKISVANNVMYFERIEGLKLPSKSKGGPMAGMMGSASQTPSPHGAPSGTGSSSPSAKSPQPNSTSTLPFTFNVPDGWTKTSPGSFAKLKFKCSAEENSAEVSVSYFPPNNEVNWESTVSMWQGQYRNPKTTGDELAKMTTKIPTEQFDGQKITITGLEEKSGDTLVGVMITRPTAKWFFKLTGKSKQVENQNANFESFVNSIKFESEEKK